LLLLLLLLRHLLPMLLPRCHQTPLLLPRCHQLLLQQPLNYRRRRHDRRPRTPPEDILRPPWKEAQLTDLLLQAQHIEFSSSKDI
jgi:hypothetical protein